MFFFSLSLFLSLDLIYSSSGFLVSSRRGGKNTATTRACDCLVLRSHQLPTKSVEIYGSERDSSYYNY